MELNPAASSNGSGESQHVKMLVIGSGPAGLSAALYGARAELDPVVLTGMTLGGRLLLRILLRTTLVSPEGLGGPELGDLFKQQAERFGAQVVFDTATEVDFSERPFKVKTYGNQYTADTVIIATGATPKHLNIPGEEEYVGKGVSYCGTCDGFFFKDKEVVVVGGGDSAMEEGTFLTRYANKVTVVHRRDELRAGAILEKRALENPKMEFVWNTQVNTIAGEDDVDYLELENRNTGEKSRFDTDGIFIFIGHKPNTEMFDGKLDMEDGYVTVNKYMETSVPGVFAAGEVADPHFRQVITSSGMGAAAAIQATRWLEDQQD